MKNNTIKIGTDGIKYYPFEEGYVTTTHERLLYLQRNSIDYGIETESQFVPELNQWTCRAFITMRKKKYTGHAQQSITDKEWGDVALQAAETKAVGRALAFAGIGIEYGFMTFEEAKPSVASDTERSNKIADTLIQSINNQKQK